MNFEQSIAALEHFITDFDLKDKDGVVNFNATVHLLMDGHFRVFESNIQIITSNHINTVYIIHGPENQSHLPEMFDPKSYNFGYAKREGLRINSNGEQPRIIVSIYPRPV
jgi:hypothetical protein